MLHIFLTHGLPSPANWYLFNGDVADRGAYACEIYLLLFGFMMACPGCVYLNRGNHESFDMNIRGYNEGGGFASEVSSKYDPDVFSLVRRWPRQPPPVAARALHLPDPPRCQSPASGQLAQT